MVTEVVHEALPVGDYACEFKNGYRPKVVFERKAIRDLFNSYRGGYKAEKKKMLKAHDMGIYFYLIIEGTYSRIGNGYRFVDQEGRVRLYEGKSMNQRLMTLKVKYEHFRVPRTSPIWCKDREEMAKYIVDFYSGIGRIALADLKAKKKGKSNG